MQGPSSTTMTLDQAVSLAADQLGAGRLEDALRISQQVVQQVPAAAGGWNMLGLALSSVGRANEAHDAYRQAVRLAPQLLGAWSNWGLLWRAQGDLGQAVQCLEQAAAIAPGHSGVLCNLATVLLEVGRVSEAIAAARRGLSIEPFPALHTGLILMLHYDPATTAQHIRAELDAWRVCFADSLRGEIRPHANDRSPDRRLRVGYLSADLRQHSVGRFMVPLLAAHDPRAVEAICYADVPRPDAMTSQLQGLAHGWRSIVGLSDAAVADLVRADGIDILVDLAMHTHANRLLVFARKPAPVQVTWLSYASSTGLPTVDYRLSDPVIDPPENTPPDAYAEQTMWLETFWCYEPLPEAANLPVEPLPADQGRGVTFGCLNLLAKVSDDTLATWGDILARVPGSQLLLHATIGIHRQRVLAAMQRAGVAPERITFVERVPLPDFLRLHARIDIGLDPFPFGGGTTTCDALWMGVPVVTLRGQTGVGRGGASLLTHVGLPELVADSRAQYVELAVDLAGDLARLRTLRGELRQRMRESVLMDKSRFARHMENAFRAMWKKWCAPNS